MFKTSTGRKIFPVPIENSIRDNVDVEDVIIFGKELKAIVALIIVNSIEDVESVINPIKLNINKLPKYEQPIAIIFSINKLSIDNNLLTNNLKIKRDNIQKRYQEYIKYILNTGLYFEDNIIKIIQL